MLALTLLLYGGVLPAGSGSVRLYLLGAFGGSALLAMRFRCGRTLVALAMLAAALAALRAYTAPSGLYLVISLALPLNFALLACTQERGLADARMALWAGILFAEAVAAGIAAQAPALAGKSLAGTSWSATVASSALPLASLIAFVLAALVVLARFLYVARAAESGWFWSMAATALALHAGGRSALAHALFATAAAVVGVAVVESSYFMAFHDELTTLPARRAFNQALHALSDNFTIAAVDVDHFKRFNDSFGHDTGDQVLRLVASRLARVGGGGKAFRTGGEEFAVLFNHCDLAQALPWLEELRLEIAETVFTVRSPDRPRDNVRNSGESRRAARTRGERDVTVTISIGAAQAGLRLVTPDQVVIAADQALYRAKQNGRNRVEVFSPARRAAAQATAHAAIHS